MERGRKGDGDRLRGERFRAKGKRERLRGERVRGAVTYPEGGEEVHGKAVSLKSFALRRRITSICVDLSYQAQ